MVRMTYPGYINDGSFICTICIRAEYLIRTLCASNLPAFTLSIVHNLLFYIDTYMDTTALLVGSSVMYFVGHL